MVPIPKAKRVADGTMTITADGDTFVGWQFRYVAVDIAEDYLHELKEDKFVQDTFLCHDPVIEIVVSCSNNYENNDVDPKPCNLRIEKFTHIGVSLEEIRLVFHLIRTKMLRQLIKPLNWMDYL